MRSGLYSVISIPVFAILYCFTVLGVKIVSIFAALNMRKPIKFISQFWAKSVFLIIGKEFKVHGMENIGKEEKYILVAKKSVIPIVLK